MKKFGLSILCFAISALFLIGAILIQTMPACAQVASALSAAPATPSAQKCSAIDGDTIRCGKIKYRLSGIDSPELPGHCRKGRDCAPGDPFAAKANMVALIAQGPVTFHRIKKDLYSRWVVIAHVGKINLSCAQISSGNAIYKSNWDDGGLVKKECGL